MVNFIKNETFVTGRGLVGCSKDAAAVIVYLVFLFGVQNFLVLQKIRSFSVKRERESGMTRQSPIIFTILIMICF